MNEKRKSQTDLEDMTTSAKARTVQDEELSLSLSLSQPSSLCGIDLNLTLSHTSSASPSPSPSKPPPASTGFQLFEKMPSPPPQQPPLLPNSNGFFHPASHQKYRPTHPMMPGLPVIENRTQFPPCRNPSLYAVEFAHTSNGWASFDAAVSPIPLSSSIQQQQLQPTSSPSTEQRRRQSPPLPSPPPSSLPMSLPPPRSTRQPRQTIPKGKDEFINPPFPWFTNRRAIVYPLEKLLEMRIRTVPGPVQCRKCDFPSDMQYELQPKLTEVMNLILEKGHTMHNCALPEWMNPTFPPCPSCQTPNCMKPVIATKKRHINSLFLLLGQSIGTCTLDQLKYFCKHTKQHRTGSKNRLLFSTYVGICKQLKPDGAFDNI